jgi:hypothetical protein
MRTVVTVETKSYPQDTNKYWAVSIDEPLNEDFVTSQPEKIWFWGPIRWEKILDLSPGTHTITVGVDTPPEKPWQAQIWINDTSLTDGQYLSTYKGKFLQFTFNVTTDAPYLTIPQAKNRVAYYPFTRLCQTVAGVPFTRDWNICSYTEQRELAFRIITYIVHWPINPNPGEQFLPGTWLLYGGQQPAPAGARSIPWFAFVKDDVQIIGELPVHAFQRAAADIYGQLCYLPAEVLLPPWQVLQYVPDGEKATFISGHIENDLAPKSQWNYVIDETITFTIEKADWCTLPPPSNPKIQIVRVTTYPQAPIDNFRPGRINLVAVEVTNAGTGIAWPFISVEEDPPPGQHYTLRENIIFTYPVKPGETTGLVIGVKLNDTMVNQGYFTIQAGHYEPPQPSNRIMLPMTPIVDQKVQIPLEFSVATLRTLSLSQLAAEKAAKIQSLTLSHTAPPPEKAAKIQSLTLSHTAPPPPPPPPPEKASLGGKVLSLLGPVADAEVTLNGFSTKTARDGSFYLTDIPYGTYTLTVKPAKTHEKILFKTYTEKIDIYTSITKTITLPLNWINLTVGAGSTIIIGTALAARKKPPTPVW